LAKAWHLPPSRFFVVAGNTDRHKTILVASAYDPLISRLQQ
jgi:uncharacterized protein YggU (UPF0235/DUF167 family)